MNPIRVGDVVLFYDQQEKVTRSASWAFQKLFSKSWRSKTAYHAALISGDHALIHAVPGGVEKNLILNVLYMDRKFGIYRYRPLAEKLNTDPNIMLLFEVEAFNCMGDAYNHRVVFRSASEQRLFCSELIAKTYSAMGVNPFGSRPERTLPTSIEEAIRQSPQDWIDITESYRTWIFGSDKAMALYDLLRTNSEIQRLLKVAQDHIEQHAHIMHAFFGEEKTHATSKFGAPAIEEGESGWQVLRGPSLVDVEASMSSEEYRVVKYFVDLLDDVDGAFTTQMLDLAYGTAGEAT